MELGLTKREQVVNFNHMVMVMKELVAMRRQSVMDKLAPVAPATGDTIATGRPPRAAAVAASMAVANGLMAQALSDSMGDGDQAWREPCRVTLEAMKKELAKRNLLGVFDRPVNPVELPTYHTVIKRPMDLGTIEERLNGTADGAYSAPQQFCDDVQLVLSNAKRFNRSETLFYHVADEIDRMFTRMWRDSGLAQAAARARRANAGVPARQVYELPAEPDTPGDTPRPTRSRGTSGGAKRRRDADGDASAGSVRLHAGRGQMSTDDVVRVAEELQAAFASEEDTPAKALILEVLSRANAIHDDEVDFERLDTRSLWELRDILDKYA